MKTAVARPFVLASAALLAFAPGLRGQSATVTTLHGFTGAGTEGALPFAALARGNDGNFYGTTQQGGGSSGDGTVFRINAAGDFATLHSFNDADGALVSAGLVQGGDGNFYGTTDGGGNGFGTIFAVTPAGVVTTLHSFSALDNGGQNGDGAYPYAGLVPGGDGRFYGTNAAGGNAGMGTVFAVNAAGVLTTLHQFTGAGTDGAAPYAGLVRGSDGNFYGTTHLGGSAGLGTVFSISAAGAYTTLHSFTGYTTTDGSIPYAALIQGGDGNFYGTTQQGGSFNSGSVFAMTPAGAVTTLHSFSASGEDGEAPYGGLVQGGDGNFYGTTANGGLRSHGTLYEVTPAGGYATLHSFAGGSEGAAPYATLVLGADGNFYGTTANGGANDKGTVFAASVVPGTPTPTPDPGTPTPTPTPEPTPTPGAPTARLVFPPANFTVPIQVPLTLVASLDDPGNTAAVVQFYANATVVGTIRVAPGASYSVMYTPPTTGFFEISAVVTDINGTATTTASVGLNVIAPPGGEAVGGIEFEGGLDQHALAAGSTVNLAAQFTAPSTAGYRAVTFYADNTPIATFDGAGTLLQAAPAPGSRPRRQDAFAVGGTVFKAPYVLPGANRLVNLIATALTNDGLTISSRPVALSVQANAQPPTIRLIDPVADGGAAPVAGRDVNIAAQVSPVAAIMRAEYYVGSAKVRDVVNPPPVFGFDFTPPTAGVYVLTAIVTNSAGLSAGSAPLTLVVKAGVPTVSVTLAGGGVVVEGAGKGVVVFTRNGGDTGAALTVAYKVKGAAKPGVDFKPVTGTLTFPAGAAKAKLKLKTLAGAAFAGTRVAKVVLLPAADGRYAPGVPAVAKLKFVAAP